MAYQSLYRKHRPQRFGELVGQEHVTTALRNAVREDRVGHAYLFSGPRGTGKTTTARLLAKALNCLDLGADGEPCGACANCEAIAAGTFLDLFELDAASNRGIDDARQLTQSMALRSALGGKKVYILDEVHMLTKEASNTLLKSLEEPPDHVVFVLATTNPESVLPTIRSRAQHFEFTLLSTEQLVAHLADICEREGVDAEPEALASVARAAAGSARDALSLLDQALAHSPGRLAAAEVDALFGGAPFELRSRILRGIADGDAAAVLIELGALLDAGHEPRRVAEDLLRAARDAFLLHAGAGRVTVESTESEHEALGSIGGALGNAGLVRVIETLGQAVVDMRGIDAADPRLVLEVALVRLARHEAGPPLVLLAERVERLERAVAAGGAAPSGAPTSRGAPASASGPGSSAGGPKPALGALRASRAEPPEAPDAAAPRPAVADPPPGAASGQPPFDLDEVVLAWADMLSGFPPATRASCQHAQPIEVGADVVVFGIAPSMFNAAHERFKSQADTIRAEFTTRFGRIPRFRLVPSDAVALVGDDPGPAGRAPRSTGAAQEPAAATDGDAPPPDDEVPLDEVVDAEPAGPAVSSVGILEAEFGATVVEERPRQPREPS